MTMTADLFSALRDGGFAEEAAKATVNSVDQAIDKRYSLHASQRVTQGDLKAGLADIKVDMANLKVDIVRWNVVTMFGAVGMIAFIMKFLR